MIRVSSSPLDVGYVITGLQLLGMGSGLSIFIDATPSCPDLFRREAYVSAVVITGHASKY